MTLVMVIYMLVGIFGYLTFATNTSNMGSNGNILQANYADNPVTVTIAILLIGFSIIVAMPLSIKPAKDSFRDILYPYSLDADPNSPVN